jgi:predicted secreted protein
MANHTGSEGTVKVGSNAVAEIRSFSVDMTADTIEDSTMGDSWRTYKSVLKTWSGSIDCYWDETDATGQGALVAGTEVTLNLYPEGSTTGDKYYTGTAIVTGMTVTQSFDGMVETTFSFQGNGALTLSTAT